MNLSTFSLENRICDSFLRVTEERLNAYGIQQYSILPSSKKEKKWNESLMKILFKKRVRTIPLTLLVAILIYCMVTYLLSSSSNFLVSVEDWIEPRKGTGSGWKWPKASSSLRQNDAINPLTPKTDYQLISPCDITPEFIIKSRLWE